jgi:hypothetical protein
MFGNIGDERERSLTKARASFPARAGSTRLLGNRSSGAHAGCGAEQTIL